MRINLAGPMRPFLETLSHLAHVIHIMVLYLGLIPEREATCSRMYCYLPACSAVELQRGLVTLHGAQGASC